MMLTVENFIKGLIIIFRGRITIKKDGQEIVFKSYYVRRYADGKRIEQNATLSINAVEQELSAMQDFVIKDYFLVREEKSYETAIYPLANTIPFWRFGEEKHFEVNEQGFHLYISKPSVQYLLALICSYGSQLDNADKLRKNIASLAHSYYDEEFSLEKICDMFRILTVRVEASVPESVGMFTNMMNSYLYNIAFNSGVAFEKLNFSENRSSFRRKISRSGQLFPYRKYNNHLVKYYYQALAADMPSTQFLAFYHVAEFFFQKLAENHALNKLKQTMTDPSFSPQNEQEIKKLYNNIKRIIREQREDGVWEEKKGLKLCLEKYVPDIESLKDKIVSLDQDAVSYYKENPITFATANGNQSDNSVKIDFDQNDDIVYQAVCNRVYLVRNAIAHSKEGEHLRYEPFRHDKELKKEMPLIRAIAEEIIINSAEQLNIPNGTS